MSSLAEVALPVGVDKTFTYLVPPDFQSSAAIGVRTIVPFGRKYATGLIVDLPPSSTLKGLKPLNDIIDARPVVSQELLGLCRWIAEYYFAPLGEVLKAALPHGFTASKRVARTSLSGPEFSTAIDGLNAHAPKRAKLLRLLAERGPMSSRDLRKTVGLKSINSVLNEMEQLGMLTTEELIARPRQKPKMREFVLLGSLDQSRIAEALQSLPSRKKKAQQLLS
ncbi:MAG: primosomal protein [Bacteroidetes bacterium]|nr:primosomal protein [Bacteroidota bacterium]